MSSMRSYPRCPSPAMVVACLALVVALGGTSYAALKLPANSVKAKQIKNGAVERSKIKDGAVDESKVAHNSLTGDSIDESTLAKVPAALAADTAASANTAAHSSTAAGLDKVTYKTATATAPAGSGNNATVACDVGQHAVGGGAKVDDPINAFVVDVYPEAGGSSWSARVGNAGSMPVGFTVYAVCATVYAVG